MEDLLKNAIQSDEKLSELVDNLIEFGDANNDKEIDYNEFKKMIEGICSMYNTEFPPEGEIRLVFSNIDVDKSQKLSKEEIKTMIRTIFA